MKLGAFQYRVELEVSFTMEEAKALCELAKLHYDDTCRAAGCRIGDVVGTVRQGKNGFLAQLTLLPPRSLMATWKFHEFDLTAKILERLPGALRSDSDRWQVLTALPSKMHDAMTAISKEYDRLHKEELCKTK
jgi:hypothetical protein